MLCVGLAGAGSSAAVAGTNGASAATSSLQKPSARVARVGAARLRADYRFDGNLKSSVAGAPKLRNVGEGNIFRRHVVPGEGRTRVLVFRNGNGLSLNTLGLVHSGLYSVVMQMRLGRVGTSDYFRILNPTLPADDNDNGLYGFGNHLTWYDDGDNDGSEEALKAKTYVEVAFTRNARGRIRVYANGEPDISYLDANKQALIRNYGLRFFVDDSNNETTWGSVSRIRLCTRALSAARVKHIYRKGH